MEEAKKLINQSISLGIVNEIQPSMETFVSGAPLATRQVPLPHLALDCIMKLKFMPGMTMVHSNIQ